MDDAQLWAQERAGEPVSHCRAKIAHDQAQMIAGRNRVALEAADRRRPRLSLFGRAAA